jgi:cytosine/adenosine deaminase-related metal-dependent hydrolase
MPVDFSQLKSFWDMLQKMGWEWLEDLTPGEGIYAATRYAGMKMLKSGTTTACEMVEGPNALPGALARSARAIEEVGLRAQVGFEVTERIPGVSILEKMDPAKAEKGFWKTSSLSSGEVREIRSPGTGRDGPAGTRRSGRALHRS